MAAPFVLLATAVLGACSDAGPQGPEDPGTPDPDPDPGYLMAHFTGEHADGEQVYFATSRDGLHWTDLNDSRPVLISTVGERGVRDPALIRSPGGDRYWIVATDLRIASGKGWGAAANDGSTSLVVWESTDLVDWSGPRLVDVASPIPEAGCAWAPEAIHDEARGDYVVYWATISPRDGVTKARIWYARTPDFRTFSEPELYIDRPGEQGIIDTRIADAHDGAGEPGDGPRYVRVSNDGQITFEGADSLLGTWTRLGDLAHAGLTGADVEGPLLFPFHDGGWGLYVDRYATGDGYLPLTTTDLDDPAAFEPLPDSDYDLGASLKRHGSVLPLSARELARVEERWKAATDG
ncbi:MAG: glycoside hydrolase family 43 protein [Gemmatimonadota bacterium]